MNEMRFAELSLLVGEHRNPLAQTMVIQCPAIQHSVGTDDQRSRMPSMPPGRQDGRIHPQTVAVEDIDSLGLDGAPQRRAEAEARGPQNPPVTGSTGHQLARSLSSKRLAGANAGR